MPQARTIPMVDPEPELSAPLSKHYDTPEYRASAERHPRWTQIKNPAPGSWCNECAMVQHEAHGRTGPRAQPRMRRAFPKDNATALRLCRRHETAWRERDAAVLGDTAKARPQGKAARR